MTKLTEVFIVGWLENSWRTDEFVVLLVAAHDVTEAAWNMRAVSVPGAPPGMLTDLPERLAPLQRPGSTGPRIPVDPGRGGVARTVCGRGSGVHRIDRRRPPTAPVLERIAPG